MIICFLTISLVKKGNFKKFVTYKQKRIGILKSGWWAGIKYFAGRARTPVPRVEAWPKKAMIHAGGPTGMASGIINNNGFGVLRAQNLAPYADNWISRRLIESTKAKRTADVKGQLENRLKKFMKKKR